MHIDKLVPAVIAALAVACLLFVGRAHGNEGYVPAVAASNQQVDSDGEPVDGLSPKAIDNIVKEHNVFRAREHVPPLT